MEKSPAKSLLRTAHSPHRNLTVSFDDKRATPKFQDIRNYVSYIASSPVSISLNSLDESVSLTSRDKLDLSRELHSSFTSSASGISFEEIACDEIDDILPKTDYTYSKSASYSTRHSHRKRCISPNMSRRRIHGSTSAFLSDVEDDFDDDDGYRDEAVTTHASRSLYNDITDGASSEQGSDTGGVRNRRPRGRDLVYTSTPHITHNISTHDHYYDGMLLRSGHKIEGPKWHVDKDGLVYEYNDSGTLLLPTPIGHSKEMDFTNMRGSVTSHESVTASLATLFSRGRRVRKSLRSSSAADMSERKRKLDETQTEKRKTQKDQYVIKHMYGLDSDDVSDTDDVDLGTSNSEESMHEERESKSWFRFFYYITTTITTMITTITTTITDGTFTPGLKTAVVTVTKSVVVPITWLASSIAKAWAWIASTTASSIAWITGTVTDGFGLFSSWLMAQASSLILADAFIKQRRSRRAGCCLWLALLLLLLPLMVLALYYWQPLAMEASRLTHASTAAGTNLGSSISTAINDGTSYVYTGLTEGASVVHDVVSKSWAGLYLWLSTLSMFASNSKTAASVKTESPPVMSASPLSSPQPPPPAIDLSELHVYIQQTVEQTWQVKGDHLQQQIQQIQVPVGMTREEVKAIVDAALEAKMQNVQQGLDGVSTDIKSMLDARSSQLETRIASLEEEMRQATQEQKMLMGNLDETRLSLEGMRVKDREEWTVASAALETKLANLQAAVGELSAQNAALSAIVGNSTSNIEDAVRAQVLAVIAQMSADENSVLSSMLREKEGQGVDKSELETKLAAASVQIQENVMGLLVAKMDEERQKRDVEREVEEKNKAMEVEIQSTSISSVDEKMVKSIVDEALVQFSADRIGLPDFALESAGGSVLSVRCSETYYRKTALVSIFGLPLWYTSNSPRTVIQPNVHPGECWAFQGQTGYIVVQLSHPIQVTSFTLEHIPRTLAPRGDISSAPKQFSIFGLSSEEDAKGLNLGNYTYENNGKPIQHYDVQNRHPGIFQLVEMRVLSNHGNPEYTCIYRFRVHGLP